MEYSRATEYSGNIEYSRVTRPAGVHRMLQRRGMCRSQPLVWLLVRGSTAAAVRLHASASQTQIMCLAPLQVRER